ncbi:MAG: hypothetical protein V8S42_04860 [Lachnospiraceae bacterium]
MEQQSRIPADREVKNVKTDSKHRRISDDGDNVKIRVPWRNEEPSPHHGGCTKGREYGRTTLENRVTDPEEKAKLLVPGADGVYEATEKAKSNKKQPITK